MVQFCQELYLDFQLSYERFICSLFLYLSDTLSMLLEIGDDFLRPVIRAIRMF